MSLQYQIGNLPFKFNPINENYQVNFTLSNSKSLSGKYDSNLFNYINLRTLTAEIYEKNEVLSKKDFPLANTVKYNNYDWKLYVCYTDKVEVYSSKFSLQNTWIPSNFDSLITLDTDPNSNRIFIWGFYLGNYRLFVCDTDFVEIKIFDFSEPELEYVKSICLVPNTDELCILNSFGQIEKINLQDGTKTIDFQFEDFISNQINNEECYYSLFYYDNTIWYYYTKDNKIHIVDLNYSNKHYLDVLDDIWYKINSISAVLSESKFYILANDKLITMNLDLSLFWIDKLEGELVNNPVVLTDFFGRSYRVFIDDFSYSQSVDGSYKIELNVSY